MSNKAEVSEIQKRFDGDVAHFSNLETGQISVIDARKALEIGTESARRLVPAAQNLLDIGCGGGNWTMMMLGKMPALNCTLIDISDQMLHKAAERVLEKTSRKAAVIQSDIRTAPLPENHFDIIIASASLHHLRTDEQWEAVFAKIYHALRPQGCFLISDLVTQESETLTSYTMEGWAAYLEEAGGKEFSLQILNLTEKEDTPRSMNYQLKLLEKSGFRSIEIIHKNMCFATFCGIK